MGTIAQKLSYAIESKEDYIKAAIEQKGVEVGNATFREYADKILAIRSGGGGIENLYFHSETPPQDTTKIWVECDEPDRVLFSDIPLSDSIEKELLSAVLPYNLCASGAVLIGDHIYIPGSGYDGDNRTDRILDFNTINETLGQSSLLLPTLMGFISPVVYEDSFYVIGGQNGYAQYNWVCKMTPSTNSRVQIGTSLLSGSVESAAIVGTKIYYIQAPWYQDTSFLCYDLANNNCTILHQQTPVRWGLFSYGEDLFASITGVGIKKYDPLTNTFSTILENTYVASQKSDIAQLSNGITVLFCGNYIMLYDPISNKISGKLLENEIYAGAIWQGWSCPCGKDNIVYLFGNNNKGSRMIQKIIINSYKTLRLSTGDAHIKLGDTMDMDYYEAEYLDLNGAISVDLYRYDETEQDWIKIVGQKIYDLGYAEDEEGF